MNGDRSIYLRRMRKNRSENRPIVFLDETWVNAHDGRERTWVEVDQTTGGTKGVVRKPTGKGTCLIILHAGSCKGWINGAELVIQSKNIIKMKQQMNILKSGLMIP